MRFTFESLKNQTIITAIVESEDERYGYRAEGPYPRIELINTQVIYEFGINNIHPDLVALLCMLSFYPFCKNKVTFPFAVSTYFEKVFSYEILPLHAVVNDVYQRTEAMVITNIDPNIKQYTGTKMAISFGGGTDSMAVHALYPEAVIVHETTQLANGSIVPDDAIKYINHLTSQNKLAFSIATNNRRTVAKPSGWTSWASAVATSVLIATDYDIGYITTGTIFGTAFFQNGKKYFPASDPNKINRWNNAFNTIGLKLFSPVAGITEVGTASICNQSNLLDWAVSCQHNNGNECHKCSKCFRKDTILSRFGIKSLTPSLMEVYTANGIHDFLNKKPLYFGHIFKYTLPSLPLSYNLIQYVNDLPEVENWIDKYYKEGLKLVPDELRLDLEIRINKFLKPMDDVYNPVIENWPTVIK